MRKTHLSDVKLREIVRLRVLERCSTRELLSRFEAGDPDVYMAAIAMVDSVSRGIPSIVPSHDRELLQDFYTCRSRIRKILEQEKDRCGPG